jgi:universal stress protein E
MRDIKRLLVAIDLHRAGTTLTAGSCIAMDHTAELAKRIGCRVVLFHARADALASAGIVLEQEAARLRALGIEAAVAMREGPAWLAIVRHVQRERIDLVLTGRRNERDHDARRIGSVARELLSNCPCPVWVAKLGGSVAPRRVLAISDLSPIGERVIETAAFVAGRYGAELHIAHAFQLAMPARVDESADIGRLVAREREERTRRLAEPLSRSEAAPRAVFHALRGSAPQVLLECAARIQPELVVMGALSHTGFTGKLIGSTAEQLLRRLDASLLVLKPDDFVCPVGGAYQRAHDAHR